MKKKEKKINSGDLSELHKGFSIPNHFNALSKECQHLDRSTFTSGGISTLEKALSTKHFLSSKYKLIMSNPQLKRHRTFQMDCPKMMEMTQVKMKSSQKI